MRNYLPACKIVSTHGVRGEMKALPLLCDGAAFLTKNSSGCSARPRRGRDPRAGCAHRGNVILLRLDGITDMDAARAQVGRVYYLAKGRCPAAQGPLLH